VGGRQLAQARARHRPKATGRALAQATAQRATVARAEPKIRRVAHHPNIVPCRMREQGIATLRRVYETEEDVRLTIKATVMGRTWETLRAGTVYAYRMLHPPKPQFVPSGMSVQVHHIVTSLDVTLAGQSVCLLTVIVRALI
jgi:hypothetical protein